MAKIALLEKNLMYRENRKSLNWFVGCRHNCVYCKPSFQAQMKRQLHNCKQCYSYEPHAHLERLQRTPPKTANGEFIFFPSSGDPAFASREKWYQAIEYCEKYSDRTFLIQSKDPVWFGAYDFPDNVILGTTVETDLTMFFQNPSPYSDYRKISKAPFPYERCQYMIELKHSRKFFTIEPILSFTFENWGIPLVDWIKPSNPEFVYVGYDNHKCFLPEPRLKDTLKLIDKLKKFTEVRLKTLRKAWWEK